MIELCFSCGNLIDLEKDDYGIIGHVFGYKKNENSLYEQDNGQPSFTMYNNNLCKKCYKKVFIKKEKKTIKRLRRKSYIRYKREKSI
jgi:hypothetical protein